MTILNLTPQNNGAYVGQTWDGNFVPDGYISIRDEFENIWEQHKPFVAITIKNGVVTSMVDNPTARLAQQTVDAELVTSLIDEDSELAKAITAATTLDQLKAALLCANGIAKVKADKK